MITGAASATRIAALSGSQHKAPDFARGISEALLTDRSDYNGCGLDRHSYLHRNRLRYPFRSATVGSTRIARSAGT